MGRSFLGRTEKDAKRSGRNATRVEKRESVNAKSRIAGNLMGDAAKVKRGATASLWIQPMVEGQRTREGAPLLARTGIWSLSRLCLTRHHGKSHQSHFCCLTKGKL